MASQSIDANPLLQSAMSMLKDSNVLTQLAFLGLSAGITTPPFARITAHEFFWGYEDQLFSLAVAYNPFAEQVPYKKFGILVKVSDGHPKCA
jgi:hypothetical protein